MFPPFKDLKHSWGTSMVVQWLRIRLPMQAMGGSIPGQGTKIPHAKGQLRSLRATTREPTHRNY